MKINDQFNLRFKIGDLVWAIHIGKGEGFNVTLVNQFMVCEIICKKPFHRNNEIWFTDIFYGLIPYIQITGTETVKYYSAASVFESIEEMTQFFKSVEQKILLNFSNDSGF